MIKSFFLLVTGPFPPPGPRRLLDTVDKKNYKVIRLFIINTNRVNENHVTGLHMCTSAQIQESNAIKYVKY